MAIPDWKYVSKVVLGEDGKVLIDLTGDTITAPDLALGVTAHGKDGAPIVGTNTFDVDSRDATANASEIIDGKTAYANGEMLTGSMPNNEAVDGKITTVEQEYQIPVGYHDGSGKVSIDATEQEKLIPGNIKDGVDVLGIVGTYTGEGVTAQSKTVTSSFQRQTVLPDREYDYLSQVTVEPIPYSEAENSAGGYTVTIGQVS